MLRQRFRSQRPRGSIRRSAPQRVRRGCKGDIYRPRARNLFFANTQVSARRCPGLPVAERNRTTPRVVFLRLVLGRQRGRSPGLIRRTFRSTVGADLPACRRGAAVACRHRLTAAMRGSRGGFAMQLRRSGTLRGTGAACGQNRKRNEEDYHPAHEGECGQSRASPVYVDPFFCQSDLAGADSSDNETFSATSLAQSCFGRPR